VLGCAGCVFKSCQRLLLKFLGAKFSVLHESGLLVFTIFSFNPLLINVPLAKYLMSLWVLHEVHIMHWKCVLRILVNLCMPVHLIYMHVHLAAILLKTKGPRDSQIPTIMHRPTCFMDAPYEDRKLARIKSYSPWPVVGGHFKVPVTCLILKCL
jgi:hypothetical protein